MTVAVVDASRTWTLSTRYRNPWTCLASCSASRSASRSASCLWVQEAFGALETTGAVLMLTSVALAAYSDKKVVHMEEEEEEETWDPHDTRIQ